MGRSIYLDQRQLLCAQCDCRQIVDGTVWHNGSGEQSDRPEGGVDLQASRLWLQRLAQGWRIHSGQKVRQIKYRMTFAKKLHSLGNLIWRSIQNVWLHFYYFCICFFIHDSKKKLQFIYGKWTEFIKITDYDSYEEYVKENAHKFKRDDKSKSPNESPVHTPRKVLSKLNSLKMASFRSLSIQDVSEAASSSRGWFVVERWNQYMNNVWSLLYVQSDDGPETSDGDLPKCDSTYSIDIPQSVTIWEADPRPPNTSEVTNDNPYWSA